MKLKSLHEDLSPSQLDAIIVAAKPKLRDRGFSNAIWGAMREFGYADDREVFDQVGVEMRRRAKVRRASIGREKEKFKEAPAASIGNPNWVRQAAARAMELYRGAVGANPDTDSVDISDAILKAAEEFGLSYGQVAGAMSR